MKSFIRLTAIAMITATTVLCLPSVDAGRVGGAVRTNAFIGLGETVSFNVEFTEGRARVSVVGEGKTAISIRIYDGDGNVTVGTGRFFDRQTATLHVYRSGVFRVEIRNMGSQGENVTIATN